MGDFSVFQAEGVRCHEIYLLRRLKKDSNVRTGYFVHVEDPKFVGEYSANKAPEKYCGLLLHVEENNIYLLDFGLLDGSRLKVDCSALFSKMLDAARILDGILFLKFPGHRSEK